MSKIIHLHQKHLKLFKNLLNSWKHNAINFLISLKISETLIETLIRDKRSATDERACASILYDIYRDKFFEFIMPEMISNRIKGDV